MPISLVSGPPASGKTTHVIDALARVYASAPFAESVLLVPTQRHADQLRRLAAERTGAAFNLRATTIAAYASELLRDAGHAILPPDVAAALLDRVAAATISGDATYFAPIRHMRGLSRLLGPAITDLLAADIDPAAFTEAAHRSTLPRLAALAAIYARYRAELETGGWLHPAQAPARAATLTTLSSPAFAAADGFRTLRAGELAFLAAVTSRAAEAVVTAEETLLPLLQSAIPSATITILADRPPAPALAIGESPDRESEVRAVARLIKEKLTTDRSLRPSSIAITARQAAPRLRLVRQVFREFDLPLDSAAAEPLSHRPLGAWLRRLLTLESGGWRLRDILPVLRSGFVDTRRWQLTPGHLGFVAGRARRNRIWGGPDLAQRITTAVRQAEPVSPFGLEAAAAFEAALAELHDILAPRILTPGQHAARLSEA
ncbi:MAG TPA: hypothetical protein VFK32_01645, partial [Tepidiformaceae bacterium]|nr:hypothetical protein [Tepidiformaceae bacterium]